MLIHTLFTLTRVYTVLAFTLDSLKTRNMIFTSSFEKTSLILLCGNVIQMPEGNWAKTSVADANKLFQGRIEGLLQGQDEVMSKPQARRLEQSSPGLSTVS